MNAPALQSPIQLAMARRTAAVLHVLVLTAALGLSVARQNPAPVLLMAAASIVAWLMVDAPGKHKPLILPAWALNTVVFGGACYLWREISGDLAEANQNIIDSLAHFILVLQACKLFERKTQRDAAQIVVLSFLVLVAGAMYSSSGIGFCIVLLGFMGVLVYAGGLLYVREEVGAMASRRHMPAVMPGSGGMSALKRDVRVVAKSCLFLAVPAALLVFLVMPRVRTPTLASSWGLGTLQTGYSGDVLFQESATLVRSDTVVMTVSITRNGEPVGSNYDEPYFRGSVQDRYRVNRQHQYEWRDSAEESRGAHLESVREKLIDHSDGDRTPTALWNDRPEPGDIVQEYKLFVPKQDALFCLATPIAFRSSQLNKLQLPPAELLVKAGEYVPANAMYSIISRGQSYTPAGEEGKTFVSPEMARDDVETNPRVAAIARTLAAGSLNAKGLVDDAAQVQGVMRIFENYLRTNYAYSLSYKQVDAAVDPTTDFILNRKASGGTCQFFASAMVVLCRSVGINARMVSGYHGGEYNSLSNEYVVRERDAHTWAEVYIPGAGWTLSDPTPGDGNARASTGVIGMWLRDLWQYVQNMWLTFIVSFDDQSRRAIAQWMTAKVGGWISYLADLPRMLKIGIWEGAAGAATRLVMAGASLGIVCAVGWLLQRWRVDRRGVHVGGGAHPLRQGGELAFLDDLLHHLERLGAHRGMHQTPREFAEALRARLGTAFIDAATLIETAYAVRFGGIHLDPAGRRQVAEAMARVRIATRSGHSSLNPHSRAV